MNLNGKVALVTGSTSFGMGRSIALTLAHRGADIVLNYGTNPRPDPLLAQADFGVPIARWLREDLAPYAEETLLRSDTILRDVFTISTIDEMLQQHKAGRTDRAYPIWTLLCFELWAREYNPQLPF